MKLLKSILDWIMVILGCDSDLRHDMVDVGALDFSGQGRNIYGK